MSDREMLTSKEQVEAEPLFLRAFAEYFRKPHEAREMGIRESYLRSCADHLEAAANEIDRLRAAVEPSVNIAQRCLYENGDFACRLEAGHTTSHWLISKDRIADEVFDSSSVEIEEQNRRLAEQVSQLEAEIERLRAAEPPSAWQPIETAPQDGRNIILAHYAYVTEGYRRIDGVHVSHQGNKPLTPFSHWMPLPSPPVTKTVRHWECDACKTVNHADRIVCVHCDAWGPVEKPARQREPTNCGYCTFEEADGELLEQCAKCKAADEKGDRCQQCDKPLPPLAQWSMPSCPECVEKAERAHEACDVCGSADCEGCLKGLRPAHETSEGLPADPYNGKILGHRLVCSINEGKQCDCDLSGDPNG